MTASTSKKVVIYRFDREPVEGFVNPQDWLGSASLEVITPSGTVSLFPYEEVKLVCFVRDFESADWKTERRRFVSRPKTEGLWVQASFKDNDLIEGILPNDLSQTETQGFLFAPPDASSNSQRLFIPRTALRELKVLGVIGVAKPRKPPASAMTEQISLFD
ncbi:MAG: hypothetical protein R2762_00430 [Bryobacteraceae bacterium]